MGSFGAFAQVPTITSFAPVSGPVGTVVSITGTNFSATPANNIIRFGATRATVTNATTTSLTVVAPVGATYEPITVLTNGLIAYSSKPFMVTLSGVPGIDASSFASKIDFGAGTNPPSINNSDLDGDGKSDLVVANVNSNTVSVYRNTSSGPGIISFATKLDFAPGASPASVSIGDLDGDGKSDLVVTNNGSSTVSVFRNTSSGPGIISYATRVDFSTAALPNSVSVGDLDRDGKADLAVTNQGSNSVSVFRNTSSGVGNINYAAKVDFTTGTDPRSVCIGDLDNDGKSDLVLVNESSSTMSIFRNTSAGAGSITFDNKVDFTTGTNPRSVCIGDLDGDGKNDLAVANTISNSVSVFRNTNTGAGISYDAKVDFTTGSNPRSVSIGDLDGDGQNDLAVANAISNSVSVFHNTSGAGNISFAAKIDFTTGTNPYSVSGGDFDADGKSDLALANTTSNDVSVLRNQMLAPEPTAQPPGPIAFFNISSTAFDASWPETNPTPDGYLAVMSANQAPTFVPLDGIPYAFVSVGSVGPNLMWVVQNSSEPGIDLSNLTLGERIYVKVYAFNGSGPTINYLTTTPLEGDQITILDPTPPAEPVNLTPATVAANSSLVFRADFTDTGGSGVGLTRVEYRPITGFGTNDFQNLYMNPTSGNTYEVVLDASLVGELGVEYRFLVYDNEGNDNLETQQVHTTQVRHENGLLIPYPNPGKTVNNYRIIAVPLVLDQPAADEVIGSWLDNYDPVNWTLYRYNGTRFAELNGQTPIEIGKGYWFLTWIGTELNSGPGTTADVSPSNPFLITLAPGWNQIGNPYNFNISWADILAANPTKVPSLGANSKIKVFRGQVLDVDELIAFEGGFRQEHQYIGHRYRHTHCKKPCRQQQKSIEWPAAQQHRPAQLGVDIRPFTR